MRRIGWAALMAGMAAAQGAAAHTPYLEPTSFAPDRDFVTVEAGMSETHAFVPDMPIRSQGDYLAVGPDGQAAKAGAPAMLKGLAAFDAPLPAEGTYRITTGDRPGRKTTWAKVDGQWKPVRPNETVPAGAETQETQSVMKAETYVTRGKPNAGALKASGQGFELQPETHPNEIFAGEAFKFTVLQDGKPLSGVAFSISRGGEVYAEKRYAYAGKTDAAGKAAVTFDQPGAYLLEAHYPARGEGPMQPVPRSVTYSLSFEVTR